jgi:hypothetical protein
VRFLAYEGAAEIEPAVSGLGFEQRLVLLLLSGPEEMHDLLPAGVQEFCDQAPVARHQSVSEHMKQGAGSASAEASAACHLSVPMRAA